MKIISTFILVIIPFLLIAKNIEQLQALAKKGDPSAQYNLAKIYLQGKGVKQDTTVAVQWLISSAKAGSLEAKFELALNFIQDEDQAFETCKEVAEKGYIPAINYLVLLFQAGGTEINLRKAFEWCKKAAQKGDPAAQFKLAYMYESGKGTAKSIQQAFRWYQKSAQQGYSNAQFTLAQLYEEGIGTDKNYEKSFYWTKKVALKDSAYAQLSLAIMYYQGTGTIQSLEKAGFWLNKAEQSGLSKETLDKLPPKFLALKEQTFSTKSQESNKHLLIYGLLAILLLVVAIRVYKYNGRINSRPPNRTI